MVQKPIEDTRQTTHRTQPPDDPQLWIMRWIVLFVACVGFLGTLVVCVLLKSPLPIAGALVLRPIITYLFPKKHTPP